MRLVTFVLLFAAACCGAADISPTGPPDLSANAVAACPAGAEQSSTAKCEYGVETSCHSPFGYDCHCLCTGYWECDQVHVICDVPDAGPPGD